MTARVLALAGLLTIATAPAALAASAVVDVRAEGTQTWAEGPVVNHGGSLDGGDGTGAHRCDGTNNGANPRPGPTAMHAAAQLLRANRVPFRARFFGDFEDFFFEQIGGDTTASGQASQRNWLFYVNGRSPTVGGCQTRLRDRDRVLFAYTTGMEPLLEADTSEGDTVSVGEALDLRVFQFSPEGARTPAAGAAIGGRTVEEDGTATLTFGSPGIQVLKATRDGAIRSNAVRICVLERGARTCPGFDITPPVISVSSPREGTLRRGPSVIAGRMRDSSEIASGRLLLQRLRGRRCQTLDRRSGRFTGSDRCGRGRGIRVPARRSFALRLRERLGRGSYLLTVRATDREGNVSTERIPFSVR